MLFIKINEIKADHQSTKRIRPLPFRNASTVSDVALVGIVRGFKPTGGWPQMFCRSIGC